MVVVRQFSIAQLALNVNGNWILVTNFLIAEQLIIALFICTGELSMEQSISKAHLIVGVLLILVFFWKCSSGMNHFNKKLS
jgi:hypothetical protein